MQLFVSHDGRQGSTWMERVIFGQSSTFLPLENHKGIQALVRELNRNSRFEQFSGGLIGPMDSTTAIDDQHRLSSGIERNLEHSERLPQLIDKRLVLTRGLTDQGKGRRVAANDQLPSPCFSATMKCSLSITRPSAQYVASFRGWFSRLAELL